MKNTKLLSRFMTAIFMLNIIFSAVSVAPISAATVSDIRGHWAEANIQKMIDQGIVTGMPEGSFKPENSISRAEFTTLVVKAFKLTKQSSQVFSDTSGHWAKDYITIANAHGIVNGYNDTEFGPDDPVTREQMAVMIVKAANLHSKGVTLSFRDSAEVSGWSQDAIAIASTQKVITGFPDGSFRPQDKATRAQAVVVISNALGSTIPVIPADNSKVYDKAGTYGPADGTAVVDGNVTIKAGNATIQNTVINGDLKIDKAVGEGTVTLKGISVKGNTYLNGGGTNSVYFIDSQTGKTYVQKDNGAVRIVVSGTTGIAHLIAQSSVDIDETNLTGKGFDNIVVDRQADGTITVNIAGVNIESLTVNCANTNIVTNASTSIGSFVANAAVNVIGDGEISNAMINASGVRLAKAPTQQTVAAGVSAPVVSTTGTGSSGGSRRSGGSNLVPVYAIAAIIGTAQVGGVLTAGTLTPAGATVSYQWVICDTIDGIYTNIPGATTDQYTPVAGGINKFIKVVAKGTGSYSGIVTSAATGPVAAVTSVVAIIGTAQVGGVLTAGRLIPAGATVSYQWVICDTIDGIYTNIQGATTDQYTPVAGDTNKFIKVVATGTGSYSGIVTSAATGPVAAVTSVTSTLSGWVNSSRAVAEANLTVYDTVCKKVYTPESSTTSEYGSFIIAVDNLPSDFRIVAQGGKCGGEAFPGELMADYRNFNPENDRVYINIVTTMVSVYLDKHPYVTLDKAVEVVKKFLNIPEFLDLGRDLQSTNEYFSPDVFVNEAGGNNNIREYIEQLVAEIDSGEGVTHSFPKVEALNGPAWDAAVWLTEKLVGGAVSYAGGQVMGWGLSECGLGGGFEKDDGNAEAIQEMKQGLNQVSTQLENLYKNLNEVQRNLSLQLEQVKDEIVLQQLKSEFDTRSGQMTELAQKIMNTRDDYVLFLNNTPQNSTLREAKREHLKNFIRDNLVFSQGVINSQLVGDGMTVPLLDLWARIVQYNHRFLSAGDYASIQAMIDYYKVLQTWQLELVVEYYHAIGEDENYHDGIDSAIKKYNDYMQAQENKAVTPIPENVLIDKLQGIMLYVGEDSIYNGVQTKSPWYGNCFDSEEKIRNMNSSSYLSFNNWRYIKTEELGSVFFGGGASRYTFVWQYLEGSGWRIPVNHEMICASEIRFMFPPMVIYRIFSTAYSTSSTVHSGARNDLMEEGGQELYWIFGRDIDKSEKYYCE